jgi:hypothetical protein
MSDFNLWIVHGFQRLEGRRIASMHSKPGAVSSIRDYLNRELGAIFDVRRVM